MIINFSADVIAAIREGNADVVDCIEILSQQVIEGNHILFLNRPDSRIVIENLNRFTPKTAALLSKSIQQTTSSYGVFAYVKKYILLTCSKNDIEEVLLEGKRAISIPISKVREKSSLISKAVFISENGDDCSFYIGYAKRFVEVSASLNFLRGVSLVCENTPGYGGNMWQAYKTKKIEAERIVFALTDSDQDRPMGKYGDTAKNLIDVHKGEPSSYLVSYHVLSVRSAENLIPYNAFIKSAETIDGAMVVKVKDLLYRGSALKCWPYLNVKKGLLCKEIHVATEVGKYLGQFFLDSKCDMCEKESCLHLLLPPVSDKILRKTSEINAESATLECFMHVEPYWREIVENLYTYFCGGKKITVF